jgi:hypothetical protein
VLLYVGGQAGGAGGVVVLHTKKERGQAHACSAIQGLEVSPTPPPPRVRAPLLCDQLTGTGPTREDDKRVAVVVGVARRHQLGTSSKKALGKVLR